VLVPTAISLSLLAFVLVPLGWALDPRFGLAGIRLAYPLSFGIGCLLQMAYFHGVWKKKPVRRLA
jgi:Na+-driven multidrug efflux pump